MYLPFNLAVVKNEEVIYRSDPADQARLQESLGL